MSDKFVVCVPRRPGSNLFDPIAHFANSACLLGVDFAKDTDLFSAKLQKANELGMLFARGSDRPYDLKPGRYLVTSPLFVSCLVEVVPSAVKVRYVA